MGPPRLAGGGGITHSSSEQQGGIQTGLTSPRPKSHTPVLTMNHRHAQEPQQGQEQHGVARPPCTSRCPAGQGAWVLPPSWFSRLHCSDFCAPLSSTVCSKRLFLKLGGDAAQQTQPNLCNSGNLSRTPKELNPESGRWKATKGGGQLSSIAWVMPLVLLPHHKGRGDNSTLSFDLRVAVSTSFYQNQMLPEQKRPSPSPELYPGQVNASWLLAGR